MQNWPAICLVDILPYKAMDAIQIAVFINAGAEAFITNDVKLRQIKELKLIILKDYL